MSARRKKFRLYMILGLLGCVFFGIGDWLLGYVEPGIIDESFMLIRLGHGESYNLTRMTATFVPGVIGMLFILPGFMGVAEIVTDKKRKKRLRFAMFICAAGRIVVHSG